MSSDKIGPVPGYIRSGFNPDGSMREKLGRDNAISGLDGMAALRISPEIPDYRKVAAGSQQKGYLNRSQRAVSVVVPTCGRVDLLNRCLAAVDAQKLPAASYEIIVVDDGPHASTKTLVEQWSQRMRSKGLDLTYVTNNGPHGPAAARNRGWRAARAPIIAFTDDDTVPTPGWLENGLASFDDAVHVLCGRVEMPLSGEPTDYERDAKNLETAEFVTANCFCRKEVLDYMNGFDERFRLAWREDSDLHFRLLGLQANILRANHAVVVHPVRPAQWGVSISQQKKIVFDALLYKKHPLLYRQKIRATPRWDYYVIVAALFLLLIGLITAHVTLALIAMALWIGMTAQFFLMRLRGTRKSLSHVIEMAVTSFLIPPHAVFWRMVGAFRFRVLFV